MGGVCFWDGGGFIFNWGGAPHGVGIGFDGFLKKIVGWGGHYGKPWRGAGGQGGGVKIPRPKLGLNSSKENTTVFQGSKLCFKQDQGKLFNQRCKEVSFPCDMLVVYVVFQQFETRADVTYINYFARKGLLHDLLHIFAKKNWLKVCLDVQF